MATLSEVAKIFGETESNIKRLTAKHRLTQQFVKKRRAKKEEKKPNSRRDKIESLTTVNNGHLKEKAVSKKMENRLFDLSKQRHIYLPEKKMTVSVSMSDTRSDEEIRQSFLRKSAEEMESCKIRDKRKVTRKPRVINEVSVRIARRN